MFGKDKQRDQTPADPRVVAFYQRLHGLTPRAWVTPAIIVINVAVFAVMIVSGVHPMTPTIQSLLDWGANHGPLTTDGQWWRLLTSTFVHIGVVHILFNMYVLWTGGPLLERLVGNGGMLILYVVAGIAGSLVSVWWNPLVTSAGASGAVFGVYGGILGVVLRQRRQIPMEVLAQLRNGILVFVGFNVVFGMSVDGIDMAAHLGGLGAGLLAGVLLGHPIEQAAAARRPARNAILAIAGAAVLAGGVAVVPRVVAGDDVLQRAAALEDRANAALERMQEGELSEEQFAALLADEVLPAWRVVRADLDRLGRQRGIDERRVAALAELLRVQEELFELWVAALRADDDGVWPALQAKQRELEELATRLKSALPDD